MHKFTAEDRAKSIATRKRKATEREATLREWFWSMVSKSEGCWTWTGQHTRAGYGHISFMGHRWRYAHRVAWELSNGPIPHGRLVCHRCDNPGCVRPDHLFLGTQADNMRDMVSKGRNASSKGTARLPHGDSHWARLRPERVRRGEQVNKAKLTAEEVLAIRAGYQRGRGNTNQVVLAKQYGVKQAAIWNILAGRTWKHITGGTSCL